MFQVIRGAHVYAPEDLGIQDVWMCGDRIIAVGEDPGVRNASEIDGTGKILVPGFIDGHVHIIGGGGEDGFPSLIPELQMTDCVRYGVTSVVGLLGTDSAVKSVRALIAKTKALRESGMSAWCLTGSYAYPSVTLTGSVRDDITFIEEIIGVKIAISDHRSSNIHKEELARLAADARYAGLLTGKAGIVHMHTGRGKKGLRDVFEIVEQTDIPISHFRPTHCGNQLKDALVFGHMGGYLDFTAGKKTAANIHRALEDVPHDHITLSSDANGSFPVWNENNELIGMGIGKMETLLETVKDMIRNEKLSVTESFAFITSNPADALKLKNKGHIRTGYDADFVLLDKGFNIRDVICLGKQAVRDGEMIIRNYYI